MEGEGSDSKTLASALGLKRVEPDGLLGEVITDQLGDEEVEGGADDEGIEASPTKSRGGLELNRRYQTNYIDPILRILNEQYTY